MTTASKKIISLILVLFVILASFVVITPVSASAASSQIKYSVSYSGKYVYLKLTPQKSTNKIYFTTDGSEVTKKSNKYTKMLGLKKKTLVKAVEVNKNNKKVAVLNILVKPRVQKPKFTLTKSGDQLYLKITSATSGAKIYYTTNGSRPSDRSKLYTGPIKVKEGMTVRVRAYKKNMNTSKIAKYKVDSSDIVTNSSKVSSAAVTSADTGTAATAAAAVAVNTDTAAVTASGDSGDTSDNAANTESFVDGVFRLMNEERFSRGVAKLTLDATLCRAADVRAKELVRSFSHERPDGTPCYTVLNDYGFKYMAVGENIAAGQTDADDVMNSWMNSTGHRNNIISPNFGRVGISCYESGGVKYWVQVFTD
jgi:uncharacterized protein YkwD